jgi:AraC-like DNA-binding protein
MPSFPDQLSSPSSELTPRTSLPRTSPRESMLSVRVVLGLVDAVERVGVTRVELLRAAELDECFLDEPESRVPRYEAYRLCEVALDLTGDPAFGLHWAERLSEHAFVPISHLIAHSSSLRQGFELLARFSQLLSDHADYAIYERGDTIALHCLPLEGESPRLKRTVAEMLVAGFWRLIRPYRVESRTPAVSFAYAAPLHLAEYTRVFEGVARFEQPFTGIVFDRALLSVPSRAKDDDVRDALEAVAERRLLRLTKDAPYAMRVRELLVREGWPHRTDMKSVARALGLSVRSLRRRLDAEDKSYNDVLNEALAIVAKDLIRDERRTTQEIAFAMGFSDTSAFYRAFKRWTGTTPSTCRGAEGSLIGRVR